MVEVHDSVRKFKLKLISLPSEDERQDKEHK